MNRLLVDAGVSPEKLHQAIMDPMRVTGLRLPTYPECVATATTRCRSDVAIKCGGAPLADSGFGLLTRSPVYPLWFGQDVADKWAYQVSYGTGGRFQAITTAAGADLSCEIADLANSNAAPGGATASTGQIGVTGTVTPNWMADFTRTIAPLAMGTDVDKPDIPFVYAPKGTSLTTLIWLNSAGATTGFMNPGTEVLLEWYTRGSETDDFNTGTWVFVNNMGYRTVTVTENAWVRPVTATVTFDSMTLANASSVMVGIVVANASAPIVTPNTGSPPTCSYTTSTVPSGAKLLPVPGTVGHQIWNFSTKAFDNVMFTGVSLTLENRTKITNKEGTIYAACISDMGRNLWYTATDSARALSATTTANPSRRYAGAAEHGAKLSVLPGKNFQKLRVHSCNPASFPGVYFPCMSFAVGDYCTLFIIQDPDPDTEQSFAASLATSWEYMVDTLFVESKVAGSALEVLHKAVQLCSTRPFLTKYEVGSVLAVTGKGEVKPKKKKKAGNGTSQAPQPAPKKKGKKKKAKSQPKTEHKKEK